VANAFPLLLLSAKSIAQANTVGEFMPMEKPKTIAAPIKLINELDKAINTIAIANKKEDTFNTLTLPILSEILPAMILTPNEANTKTTIVRHNG